MSRAGFELAIPTSERPQTHALDRTATEKGYDVCPALMKSGDSQRLKLTILRNDCKVSKSSQICLQWYKHVAINCLYDVCSPTQGQLHG